MESPRSARTGAAEYTPVLEAIEPIAPRGVKVIQTRANATEQIPAATVRVAETVPQFLDNIVAFFNADKDFITDWQSIASIFIENPPGFQGVNKAKRIARTLLSALSLQYCHANSDTLQVWMANSISAANRDKYRNLATFAASQVIESKYHDLLDGWIRNLTQITPDWYPQLETIIAKLSTPHRKPESDETKMKRCLDALAPEILIELKNAEEAAIAEFYLEENRHHTILQQILTYYRSPNSEMMRAFVQSTTVPKK